MSLSYLSKSSRGLTSTLAGSSQLVLRQLFDKTSSTYTYLLGDTKSGEAVLIDPVLSHIDRDLGVMTEVIEHPKLKYAINTHIHADHSTATGRLKQQVFDMKTVLGQNGNEEAKADLKVADGAALHFGEYALKFLHTPGHTVGCHTLLLENDNVKMAFTGDTVLIRGCGRTDFQNGDADKLYDSVHDKIFTLDDDTIIFPGHDYRGRTMSTVGEEKVHNPRLTKDRETFKDIMTHLNLPYPRLMNYAVPFNAVCGLHEIDAETEAEEEAESTAQ